MKKPWARGNLINSGSGAHQKYYESIKEKPCVPANSVNMPTERFELPISRL